ncbi:MAG: hypothetical protein ACLUSL_11630 [Ruminococcus sp.]
MIMQSTFASCKFRLWMARRISLSRGLFPLPPVAGALPEFEILTVPAAKCKKCAVINGEDLPTHHVENIRCNEMRHTATPPNSAETMFQNVEILVTAVHESNGKWLLPQLPQCHLF